MLVSFGDFSCLGFLPSLSNQKPKGENTSRKRAEPGVLSTGSFTTDSPFGAIIKKTLPRWWVVNEREDTTGEDNYQPTRTPWKEEEEFSFPRLVVFCLLLSSLRFTPTKRYEEVDGVRKEKERLTTDHQRRTTLWKGNERLAELLMV